MNKGHIAFGIAVAFILWGNSSNRVEGNNYISGPSDPIKDIFKKLKVENRTTLPKIPTSKIFFNDVSVLGRDITKVSDPYLEDDSYMKLPKERVPVSKIVPTQRSLNINNLEEVKNIGTDTGAFLLKNNNLYYAMDGHHRIAMNILKGEPEVTAYVKTYIN